MGGRWEKGIRGVGGGGSHKNVKGSSHYLSSARTSSATCAMLAPLSLESASRAAPLPRLPPSPSALPLSCPHLPITVPTLPAPRSK